MPFLSDQPSGAPDQFMYPPSPGCEGGEIRYFMNDGGGVQSASSRRGGAEVSTSTKEQMNERFGPGVQRLADGSVPGRFPILRDPKTFHWNEYVIGFSSSDGQPMLVESFMNLDSGELDSYLVPEEVLPDEESKVDSGDSKEEDLFVGSQPQVDSSGERIVIDAYSVAGDDDAFKHSEAFKDLFHVYATKVVKISDVIKGLSTNGWKDPAIAEWKRILVNFPCLKALDSLPAGAKAVPLMWVLNQKQAADGFVLFLFVFVLYFETPHDQADAYPKAFLYPGFNSIGIRTSVIASSPTSTQV